MECLMNRTKKNPPHEFVDGFLVSLSRYNKPNNKLTSLLLPIGGYIMWCIYNTKFNRYTQQ